MQYFLNFGYQICFWQAKTSDFNILSKGCHQLLIWIRVINFGQLISFSVTRRARAKIEWVREMVLMMDKKEEDSSSTDYDSDNVRHVVISLRFSESLRSFPWYFDERLMSLSLGEISKMTIPKVKVISIPKSSLFHLEWVPKRSTPKFIWLIKIRLRIHPMKLIYPDFMMFVEKFWLNRSPLVILAVGSTIDALNVHLSFLQVYCANWNIHRQQTG